MPHIALNRATGQNLARIAILILHFKGKWIILLEHAERTYILWLHCLKRGTHTKAHNTFASPWHDPYPSMRPSIHAFMLLHTSMHACIHVCMHRYLRTYLSTYLQSMRGLTRFPGASGASLDASVTGTSGVTLPLREDVTGSSTTDLSTEAGLKFLGIFVFHKNLESWI